MCSRLKKDLCLASDECTWVVGKGCQKKTVANTPKKNANVAQVPKKNATKPQVKKVQQVAPQVKKNANAGIPDPKNPWRNGYGWSLDVPAWYSIGYSPSGRAMCHGCKAKIGKDELRMGRHGVSPFGDGDQIKYFHFDHFFPALLKSHCNKTNCIEWNTLNGVQELTPADKKRAYQRITAFGAEWQKKCKGVVPEKKKVITQTYINGVLKS